MLAHYLIFVKKSPGLTFGLKQVISRDIVLKQPTETAMAVRASSYKLNVFCKKHPNYRGLRKSGCPTCVLIFILRWQHTRDAEKRLGGLNPYQVIDLQNACEGLVVKPELAPSRLQFTKKPSTEQMHYLECPAHPANVERMKTMDPEMRKAVDVGCTCSFLSRT